MNELRVNVFSTDVCGMPLEYELLLDERRLAWASSPEGLERLQYGLERLCDQKGYVLSPKFAEPGDRVLSLADYAGTVHTLELGLVEPSQSGVGYLRVQWQSSTLEYARRTAPVVVCEELPF